MSAIACEERRDALAVACGLTVTTLAVAAIVRVGWAAETRRLLGFAFTGVPARLDTAVSIFAGNARLLTAVFAAILVAQSPGARRDVRCRLEDACPVEACVGEGGRLSRCPRSPRHVV